MSALDELKKKDGYTALEWAVVELSNQDSVLGLNCKNWYEEAAADLADKDAELLALRERVAWWLENYDITMPCGHKNRYLLTDGRGELEKGFRGDCVCVICQLEKADNEILAALKSQ